MNLEGIDFYAMQLLAREIIGIVGSPLVNLLIASVFLAIGLWLSGILQQSVTYVLDKVGFDRITEPLGISKALHESELDHRLSRLLGKGGYWLGVLLTLVVVAGLFDVATPKYLAGLLLPYLTIAVRAALVFGVALFLAGAVSSFVQVVSSAAGFRHGKTLGHIAKYSIIVSSFLAILTMLGIRTEWIMASMTFIIGAVAAGFAIAFGLGSKEMAGGFMTQLFKR